MLRPSAWWLAWAVGVLVSCDGHPPMPRLTAVQPARAHTDRSLRLRLLGTDLWPAWQLDLTTGTRTGDARDFSGELRGATGVQALTEFAWLGSGELSATLPVGLAAGRYAVALRDPRGAQAQLADGFESLGADTDPPLIRLEQPANGARTAPGARLPARLSVEDAGSVAAVRWELRRTTPLTEGRCPVAPGAATVTCSFEIAFPDDVSPGETLELQVEATDGAELPNVARISRSFLLGPRPALLEVTPPRGGTGGGTEVVIRGSGFLPGSRVYFGRALLQPEGGIRLDDGTLTGRTPPHAEGGALVRVETPLGDARASEGQGLFEFAPPPTPRQLVPSAAPAAGGAELVVTGDHFTGTTRLLAGTSLRTAVPLPGQLVVSASEMRAISPVGQGRISLFAVDPYTGWGGLPDALVLGP
jgi:hypothetical protein